jgi:hypothetical protein
MILSFLRCFAAFRRLEEDLLESRTTVGTERELRLRADAEAHRVWAAYESAHSGQIEALKMLNNVAIQTSIGCLPPHPEVWSLPARKPKAVDFAPIETGRVSPTDVVGKAREQFTADVIEFCKPKQSAS